MEQDDYLEQDDKTANVPVYNLTVKLLCLSWAAMHYSLLSNNTRNNAAGIVSESCFSSK